MEVDSIREDSTPLIKTQIPYPIRVGYNKHAHLYPYPFGVCIFLFMLYRIFPPLFFFILRSCPVFAITSLLLTALIAYGKKESNHAEFCNRNNESEEKSENQRNPEKERFRRLTSLIERRRARMSIRHEIKRNLDPNVETNDEDRDSEASVSPINIPKWDPFSDKHDNIEHVPGSAPSVLHHRRTNVFEEFLPGATRFARLDPFLVTEMDLAERRGDVNRACARQARSVSKEMKLIKRLSLRAERGDSAADVRGVDVRRIRGESLGSDVFNADNSQLESIEETLAPTEISKDMANGADSYCDTILLSEFLNLCSGNLPPRKAQTLPASFPLDKFEVSEIEPSEEIEIIEPIYGERDENLELEERIVDNAPDNDSHNFVSDTKDFALDTVKSNENEGILEFEEDPRSVKEVKSILKQIRREIVRDETVMKALSDPKVVEEREKEGEENISDASEPDVTPDTDSLLERSPLSESIASNLKMLRKQNKHGDSSSSGSSDFD